MPAKDTSDAGEQPCRRCRESSSVLVVRGEPLCRECFVKYVHTKAIKRMESLRVRHSAPGQQRKVLLPLSFGVSSVILLHVLDHHLKTQASKTGRTGFSIMALSVDDSTILKVPVSYPLLLARIQEQYPDHEYLSLPLHDVFRLLPTDSSLLALTTDTNVSTDTPPDQRFGALLKSLPSATARADVISTLRTRLIVEHAMSLGCEGILWGDSTTKLAEKTLSETAKGRGFSLPWRTADGESPFGITFNYPLRDLLKKELVAFARLNEPPLSPLVLDNSGASAQASMSSKNTTIDDLMKQYFESVEEKFPSIVANVVRTTSKLEANSIRQTDRRCDLCSMPVSDGRFGIHGWGGDQQDGMAGALVGDGENLCYGCTRSIPHSNAAPV